MISTVLETSQASKGLPEGECVRRDLKEEGGRCEHTVGRVWRRLPGARSTDEVWGQAALLASALYQGQKAVQHVLTLTLQRAARAQCG